MGTLLHRGLSNYCFGWCQALGLSADSSGDLSACIVSDGYI